MKSVSGKEFCKILARQGWTYVHTRGSHKKYSHPDGQTIVVPVHGNDSLKKGLQRALMRMSGITERDL
jgi:predicted RNA binding protein YcfA (HicA-like mRNA interferase family)